MPTKRLPMRKIRDALLLHADGLSKRKIAASLNVGPTSAGEHVRRTRRAGLSWPVPGEVTDEALEVTIRRNHWSQPAEWTSLRLRNIVCPSKAQS